jgi:hypothetical protein
VVNVSRSSAVNANPRSMRLPMSIIVQPTSCTIDSAATPDSANMPASVRLFVDARNASPSVLDSGGESGA